MMQAIAVPNSAQTSESPHEPRVQGGDDALDLVDAGEVLHYAPEHRPALALQRGREGRAGQAPAGNVLVDE